MGCFFFQADIFEINSKLQIPNSNPWIRLIASLEFGICNPSYFNRIGMAGLNYQKNADRSAIYLGFGIVIGEGFRFGKERCGGRCFRNPDGLKPHGISEFPDLTAFIGIP